FEVSELKDMVRALLLDKKNQSSAPASSSTPTPVKVVEPNCVTCGGTHSYQNCPTTSENVYRDNIQDVSIPYPSRRDNERRRDQANEQIEKLYEIFKEMSFVISFTDSLILMPKFDSTLKALIGNKEKLSEMARTPINKHCSALILNKLPRKLGDPDKFLIPCEFPGMDECLALADHADFVVVEFEPDPRVPLILGRCFLKTGRALIDVHKGKLTLRIGNEAITYNLDQTVRYSANYNQMTTNKIDVIYEMYSQEVLSFSDVTASGNPTTYDDPIVSTTSHTLTLFGDSDFLLFEEADAFLGLEDDPNSLEFNPFYYDPEGDILLLKAILNSEPLPPIPNHKQYMPLYKKELKVCEAKTVKSSIDEPPEVCEEYSQEVLGFSDVTASGSPTPSDDPIVFTTSPTLTPFGDSDFLLFEEADAFLGLEDDPDSPELDPSYYDPEGDILSLEAILNSDPSPPLPNHKQSMRKNRSDKGFEVPQASHRLETI
nr:hypothetical protein [Tanacetum cinerariifolium]